MQIHLQQVIAVYLRTASIWLSIIS